MRLSTFIIDNIEPVLLEWVNFARTLFKDEQNIAVLRDDAKEMLMTIALDLQQAQSQAEQIAKSKGEQQPDLLATAAEDHGFARLKEGLNINEMVSEYRALRASVTKLWRKACKTIKKSDMDDLVRFNEAIDQSINESVAIYSFYKEKQARLFEAILASSPDLSYILDKKGMFLYANKAMIDLHQLPLQEMIGKVFYDFVMFSEAEERTRFQSVVATQEPSQRDIEFVAPSGRKYVFESIYAPVFNENGTLEAIVGTSRDITERRIAEEKIWVMANYDHLTNLPNRRLFRDRLAQAIMHAEREKESFALFFIDLDRFKTINDALGHDAGDSLLKQTGERIKACVRDIDTVARIGGEEFVVILTNVDSTESMKDIIKNIQTKLSKPFKIKRELANIAASIGIAIFPQDGKQSDILLGHADQAMYIAKQAGGNQFKFYSNC